MKTLTWLQTWRKKKQNIKKFHINDINNEYWAPAVNQKQKSFYFHLIPFDYFVCSDGMRNFKSRKKKFMLAWDYGFFPARNLVLFVSFRFWYDGNNKNNFILYIDTCILSKP